MLLHHSIRAVVAAAVVVLLLGSFAPAAGAAPPPEEPNPVECLGAFDADIDYVGEGWPGAVVTSASNDAGEFTLRCGDELSGVIHIAHPASTGTVHPIRDERDGTFAASCFELVIEAGTPSPDGAGRTRYVLNRELADTVATVIVDDARGFAYTMFATGPHADGNDWLGCSISLA